MDLYYGTYLTYLVQNTIRTSKEGLTVKQIEELIYLYPTRRQQMNFRKRIRLALKSLCENDCIATAEAKGDRNIISIKYSINYAKETEKQ